MDRIKRLCLCRHATVRGAEVWGEPGNPDVDRSFAHWPSDHRAVVVDPSATPVAAPAKDRGRAAPAAEGGTFVVRGHLLGDVDWGGGGIAARRRCCRPGSSPGRRADRHMEPCLPPLDLPDARPRMPRRIDAEGAERAAAGLGGGRWGKPVISVASATVESRRSGGQLVRGAAPGWKYDWDQGAPGRRPQCLQPSGLRLYRRRSRTGRWN